MRKTIYRSYFVYKSVELLTNLIYIGQAQRAIKKRMNEHFKFQRTDFDKAYTSHDNFKTEAIDQIDNVLHNDPDEQCWREYLSSVYATEDQPKWRFKSQDQILLDQMERYYIWRENAQDESIGYNRTPGGVGFNNSIEHQTKASKLGTKTWLANTTTQQRSNQAKARQLPRKEKFEQETGLKYYSKQDARQTWNHLTLCVIPKFGHFCPQEWVQGEFRLCYFIAAMGLKPGEPGQFILSFKDGEFVWERYNRSLNYLKRNVSNPRQLQTGDQLLQVPALLKSSVCC